MEISQMKHKFSNEPPIDAADRTVMLSPKSTYKEATSPLAVLKAGQLLNSVTVYLKILQGYTTHQLHSTHCSLLSSCSG